MVEGGKLPVNTSKNNFPISDVDEMNKINGKVAFLVRIANLGILQALSLDDLINSNDPAGLIDHFAKERRDNKIKEADDIGKVA